MPLPRNISSMFGDPVGVSFRSRQDTCGILCGIENDEILLIEYMYQEVFALNRYPTRNIQSIRPFPPCRKISYGSSHKHEHQQRLY